MPELKKVEDHVGGLGEIACRGDMQQGETDLERAASELTTRFSADTSQYK